jgi:hypothetical protein
MNTLIVGIGECGRNITLQLYYQLSSMQHKYLMKNFEFFLTDSEDSLRMVGDIKRKGVPPEAINPEKADDKVKSLNVFMLSPSRSYAGVGGAWLISSEMARTFFSQAEGDNKKYIDLLNLPAQYCECFNIINSAGGGTGNGAGPVFLEYLRNASAEDAARKLYTATIVLPFKGESGGWRDVNAAVNIARFSKLCDGILIADNDHVKNIIKQNTENVQKAVNELISNVWMWMNVCSSMHLNVSPKRWEGADFKRNFNIGEYSPPVVPCFREEPVEKLRRIKMEWIVFRTIRDNCAAECLPETSQRILVIASIPEREVCTSSESDIAEYLSIELLKNKKSAIDVIFIKGKALKYASVCVLLVGPKIPRFKELESNFNIYLEDPKLFEKDMLGAKRSTESNEALNAYRKEYEYFKKYLEYLGTFAKGNSQ